MFKKLSNIFLNHKQQFEIVYRYTPKRSPFDKTQYIEEYVARPNQYHKSRKPRLAQWDDPAVQWPKLLPQTTKLQYKQLIQSIEQREKVIVERNRNFHIPDFRTGDVVQVTYLHSISSLKGNAFTGLVTSKKQPNSLDASFNLLFRFCGVQVEMLIKLHSPLLNDFKLVKKGSGNLAARLNWVAPMRLTKENLQKAKFKGKQIRARKDEKRVRKISRVNQSSKMIQDQDIDPLLE